jgi:hypothetical protein
MLNKNALKRWATRHLPVPELATEIRASRPVESSSEGGEVLRRISEFSDFEYRGAMTVSMRWACCFLALIVFPQLSGAQMNAGESASVTPRKFVEEFYGWYVPLALNDHVSRAWEAAVREKPSAFGSQLAQLIRDDSEAQSKCEELVGLDWDPFLRSQDPAEHYEVGTISQTAQRYRAEIYSVESGKRSVQPQVVAEFSKQNGRWFFTNFYYLDRSNLVKILKSPKVPCTQPRPAAKK